ncbi:MAG: glycosyltransferase [Planctomycetaceae bacterium]
MPGSRHQFANPPPVRHIPDGIARPRFSVMIPTFEPDGKLRDAIASVLGQGWPADDLEIVVVDDGSTAANPARVVRDIDHCGRVAVVAHDQRLGLAGNWNRAIALARGELVHLLHQDDIVRPGFYAALDRGFRRAPDIGMAFCRSTIVDDHGRRVKTSSRQRWLAGILDGWLSTIAERQRIQTPSAVVARATYEALGGYRTDLCHALDWEMWVRIAAHFRVWYEPRPLAIYRRHDANETSRLFASGAVWPDMARALRINAATLPDAVRDSTLAASVRWHAASAMRTAERQLAAGATAEAAHTLRSIPDILDVLHGRSVEGVATRRLAALRARLRSDGRERRAA